MKTQTINLARHVSTKLWEELCREYGIRATTIACSGNVEILGAPLLGLLCSRKYPGEIILPMLDSVRALRDKLLPVISGFQSPLEHEALTALLRGTQPIVICLGREIDTYRPNREMKKPMAEGRLLYCSLFGKRSRRVSTNNAAKRNALVAALADVNFIPYAARGGNVEKLALLLLANRQPVLTLEHPDNVRLLDRGAVAVMAENIYTTVRKVRAER